MYPPPPHCHTFILPHTSIFLQCIYLPPSTCFSAPTLLTLVIVIVIPAHFVCIMYILYDVCMYYVHLPNAGFVQHLLFPFPFCHTTLLPSPLPISTRPTSSRWVPPYVPWFCLRFLPD